MKTVIVESPYAGDVQRNLKYLERCLRYCVERDESPYASHKMLTTCLDDNNQSERDLGIKAGLAWREIAEMRIFFVDHGWSKGMLLAKELYDKEDLPYEIRYIGVSE